MPGLVKLGHVALDGTKGAANASKQKAMPCGRMGAAERRLAAEVGARFERAEAVDGEEDRTFGADARGDELPEWVKDKQARLARLRAAKAALETEAPADDDGPGPSPGMMEKGRPKRASGGGPPARAQRNFTDPDSRLLKTKDGFIQGYNAQAAVDAEAQVVVAHGLTTTDQAQLAPMLDAIEANTGRRPREISADAGYCSEANLGLLAERKVAAMLAIGPLHRYRLVQRDAESIDVAQVAERRLDEAETRALEAALAQAFGHPFRFDIVHCDDLPRGPGGKFEDFRCEIAG